MFSTLRPQYPSPSNDIYSRPPLNSRDRYLAALAEAKAAEADYLADEAVRREEEALRQRLEEIQLRKRHEQFSRYRQPFESYSHSHGSHDRLSLLRQELEEEELRQAAAASRRREFEEARALVLKRRQEEQTLELLTRRRQEEEKRLLALRQEQKAARRVHQTSSRPAIQFVLEAEKTPQPLSMLSHQHVPTCTPFTTRSVPACSSTQPKQFDEVLKLLSGQAIRPRDSPKKAVFPSKPVGRFVIDEAKARSNKSSESPVPQKRSTSSSTSQAQVLTPPINEQLQSRPNEEEANEIRDIIQAIFASLADAATYATSGNVDSSAKQSTPSTASSSVPSSSNKGEKKLAEPTRAFSPASSLKEQLEARLRNDETVEIRDTIQAILASLADTASTTLSSSVSSASSDSSSSAKGKGKENIASESTDTTEPTSADVLKSMETVRNIEASFLTLQSDFVFPSQIDFTPTSSRSPSPTRSSDNEPLTPTSDSTILKLAYTSRNHPVRYYEQTLSALLTRLDDVQSFGNEQVRTLRKEVVGRVKKAIDELEGEIEGRWRSKVAKEARETRETEETNVTEPSLVDLVASTESDQSASHNQSSTAESASDSTEEAEPQIELKSDDLGGQILTFTVEKQSQDSEQTQVAESETTVDPGTSSSSLSAEAEPGLLHDIANTIQDVDESLQQGAAPHQCASYPPASSTSSTTPSLSTSSSVATIRPYGVEPAPLESKPVSLSMSIDLSETRTSLSGSEDDFEGADTVLPSITPSASEIQPGATQAKSESVLRHDSDSDWSEVEA
ncbi:hypothetical protein VKT23_002947 [Stygiomarasmius scandens]|uniref:BAG domain-containing protein n=1 Tax=Marasmiellus scandens TaxID=2682957 RepID=A0ABR1JVN6_9AGAR